jgi:hypothetical protein
MARFEMYLFMVESEKQTIESSEYELICWVKNSEDLNEIQSVANDVINNHIEEAENTVMFGTASIMVRGEEVMNLGFRNNEIDPDKIDEVIDLISTGEEVEH